MIAYKSEHIRNHPLRSFGVLEILRVRLFEQSLLAKHSGERAKKQQHTQRSALPRPMGNNATPTEETGRCVDWISNVPIRACRHKPASRGFCRGMEASTSKRHACPDHQGYCDHLKSNRCRLKRKKAANRVQANQGCDHDQEPKEGYHFQHSVISSKPGGQNGLTPSSPVRATIKPNHGQRPIINMPTCAAQVKHELCGWRCCLV